VHALDEAAKSDEVEKQSKPDREKVNMQPDYDTKRVLLDAMVLDQTIVIGSDLAPDEEGSLVQFLQKILRLTKMCLPGPPRILQAWIEVSSSTD
jgi:hypothetical protein